MRKLNLMVKHRLPTSRRNAVFTRGCCSAWGVQQMRPKVFWSKRAVKGAVWPWPSDECRMTIHIESLFFFGPVPDEKFKFLHWS